MVPIQMQKRAKKKTNSIAKIETDWDRCFWKAYHLLDEDYDKTIEWFDTPNPKLGYKKPSALVFSPIGRLKLLKMLEGV